MAIKTTTDRAAVVDTEIKWIPVSEQQPPIGAKLLAINKAFGVAHITPWGNNHGWTHWFPLPTFKE